MTKLMILTVLTSCSLVASVAVADKDDAKMLAKAKISLVEAITAAEAHQGGQAFNAEIEDDSFNPEYEVKILKEDKIFKVTVDGVSGKVTRVKEK